MQAVLPLQAEKAASHLLSYPLLANRGYLMPGAGFQAGSLTMGDIWGKATFSCEPGPAEKTGTG